MSNRLIRVAELDLHQEIAEEALRESMRQYAENVRNLQRQLDDLIIRVELLEAKVDD